MPWSPVNKQALDALRKNGWSYRSGGGSGGTGSSVQPDWNQNDPAAADYVKNRPYYKKITRVNFNDAFGATLYPATFTTVENNGMYIAQGDFIYDNYGENEVVFDGVTYLCVPAENGTIGGKSDGMTIDFSEYPFYIENGFIATKDPGEHTIESVHIYLETTETNYMPRFVIYSKWSRDTGSASVTVEDAESLVEQWDKGVPCFVDVRTAKAIGNNCAVVDVSGINIFAIGFGLGGFLTVSINTTTGAITTNKYTATEVTT